MIVPKTRSRFPKAESRGLAEVLLITICSLGGFFWLAEGVIELATNQTDVIAETFGGRQVIAGNKPVKLGENPTEADPNDPKILSGLGGVVFNDPEQSWIAPWEPKLPLDSAALTVELEPTNAAEQAATGRIATLGNEDEGDFLELRWSDDGEAVEWQRSLTGATVRATVSQESAIRVRALWRRHSTGDILTITTAAVERDGGNVEWAPTQIVESSLAEQISLLEGYRLGGGVGYAVRSAEMFANKKSVAATPDRPESAGWEIGPGETGAMPVDDGSPAMSFSSGSDDGAPDYLTVVEGREALVDSSGSFGAVIAFRQDERTHPSSTLVDFGGIQITQGGSGDRCTVSGQTSDGAEFAVEALGEIEPRRLTICAVLVENGTIRAWQHGSGSSSAATFDGEIELLDARVGWQAEESMESAGVWRLHALATYDLELPTNKDLDRAASIIQKAHGER